MNASPSFQDMTLDELRLALAPLVAESAIFDGWNEAAVDQAAQSQGVDKDVARLAYSDGAMDMIAAWIETIDLSMQGSFTAEELADMKIRERITSLVWARLESLIGLEEALRRAQAIMAMPQNVPTAFKIGWHSADLMWRMAGDTSTDYNYYSKRTILGSIYGACLVVFADDDSEGKAQTRAFLDRRIEGVMRFEKAKAKWLGKTNAQNSFSMARFLGRLRYPAR